MFKNLVLSLAFIGIFIGQVSSQDCALLAIESQEVMPNEQVCLDISILSPEDDATLQGTINWDPEVLQFDSFEYINPMLYDGLFSFNNTDLLDQGAIPFSWVYDLINPIPAFESTDLFTICFIAMDTIFDGTTVQLTDDPTPVELFNTSFEIIDYCQSEGIVNITNSPSSSTSPFLHGYTQDKNCEIGQVGGIQIFPFFGTEPYSFLWSSNNGYSSTEQNITNLELGLYSVTLTDDNGNTASDTFEIFELGTPTLPIPNFTRPECENDSTGMIDISPNFGTPPYTYAWSNNTFDEDLTNVPSGTYDVTVTDSNGCHATGSWILNISNYHVLSLWFGGSPCPTGMDGFIEIEPNPYAAMPLTFEWSNGATSEDLINIPNDIYYLTVTDFDGCLNFYEFDLTVSSTPAVVSKDLICPTFGNADGSATITLTYNLPEFTFHWEDGSTSMNGERSMLTAGNYSFTVADDNGCELIVDSFTLESPIENFEDTYFSCGLDSIALDFTSTSDADTFIWSPSQYFDQPTSEDAILLSPDFDFSNGNPAPVDLSLLTYGTSGCLADFDFRILPFENCVWPGDTDDDNTVTSLDFLNIALVNGATGFERGPQSSEWNAQLVIPWNDYIPGTNLDQSHADCDGNGTVEAADTTVVLQNFGLSHYGFNSPDGDNRSMEIPLSINLPEEFNAADQNQFEVILGDETNSLDEVYGLAFQLVFDEEMVEGKKGIVTAAGWLSEGNTPWTINIDDISPGVLDVILTRNNGTGANGFGEIGSLYLPFKSFVHNESVAIEIRNAVLINSSGEFFPVEESISTGTLIGTSVGISNHDLIRTEYIFPNPTSEIINIYSERKIDQIIIQDLNGRQLINNSSGEGLINIKSLPEGAYMIQLIGSNLITSHRFIKVN